MAHPYQAHKDHIVQHQRVPHIARGYASGGAVTQETAPPSVPGGAVKAPALRADGGAVKARLDRPGRAKGGRAPKKGTHVNVIVAPQNHPAMPMAGAGGPSTAPALPPRPPMAPPPMAGAAPMPPGMPPAPGASPIRRTGGRAYAQGGAVFAAGRRNGTQVQHSGNKMDGPDIGRGPVITKKTGGAVEHPMYGGMGPKIMAGGKSGLGRLAKARRAARG